MLTTRERFTSIYIHTPEHVLQLKHRHNTNTHILTGAPLLLLRGCFLFVFQTKKQLFQSRSLSNMWLSFTTPTAFNESSRYKDRIVFPFLNWWLKLKRNVFADILSTVWNLDVCVCLTVIMLLSACCMMTWDDVTPLLDTLWLQHYVITTFPQIETFIYLNCRRNQAFIWNRLVLQAGLYF